MFEFGFCRQRISDFVHKFCIFYKTHPYNLIDYLGYRVSITRKVKYKIIRSCILSKSNYMIRYLELKFNEVFDEFYKQLVKFLS